MKRTMPWVLIALLLPIGVSAQQRQQAPRQNTMAPPNVARLLLNSRAELGLTNDQISRLEALANTSDERQNAASAELRTLREKAAAGTELTEEERGRMRDAMRQAAEARREAGSGIRSILTMEQFDRAAMLGAALRGLGGQRGPALGARQGRGPGAMGPRARMGDRPGRFAPQQRGRFAPPRRRMGPGGGELPIGPQQRRRIGPPGDAESPMAPRFRRQSG